MYKKKLIGKWFFYIINGYTNIESIDRSVNVLLV